MPKKERIPPPGSKKDPYTNFMSKGKWKAALLRNSLEIPGRNLRGPGALIVGNAIARSKFLMTIDFSHNNLGDQGAVHLAQFLKLNELISVVNLSSNGIGDIGGIALASAFIPCANPTGQPSQWNRSIVQLNLAGNQLGDDAMLALCNAMACHRGLERLELHYNRIGAMGLKGLARAMSRSNFCQLTLASNAIGDEGCAAICAAWERYGQKGAQAVLGLFSNNVSIAGAEAIGRLLAVTDFVTDVNLALNTVGPRGMQLMVAPMLTATKLVLRVLNLADNAIGDDGAVELAKLIATNPPSLVKVNASSNGISDRGAKALASALHSNTSLQFLLLSHNHYGAAAVAAFCDLVQVTKTLKLLDLKRSGLTEEMNRRLADSSSQEVRVDYGVVEERLSWADFELKIGDMFTKVLEEEERQKRRRKAK